MTAPIQSGSGAIWSLWDMLEINAQAFMDAVMEVRRVQAIIEHGGSDDERKMSIKREIRDNILVHVEALSIAIESLYARVTGISVGRLKLWLQSEQEYSWNQLREAEADIESRLRDELGLVRLFVLNQQESVYLLAGPDLLGPVIPDRFPSVIFEMEEASKCVALGRPTASAFHSMRALEVAIRSLARLLEIPDPIEPAARNWAIVLKTIKAKIDEKYPAKGRRKGTEGAAVEGLYASLDAIKNPWRNATMHVENVYQPHEANHILQCVNVFLLALAQVCDENGERPANDAT